MIGSACVPMFCNSWLGSNLLRGSLPAALELAWLGLSPATLRSALELAVSAMAHSMGNSTFARSVATLTEVSARSVAALLAGASVSCAFALKYSFAFAINVSFLVCQK